MNEVQIKYENNQMLVTSIRIARDFNKEHKNVLKDIRTLIQMGDAQNLADLFHETTYIHEQNKQEYPMYLINRDGFTLLTMGFIGKEALERKFKYINALNESATLTFLNNHHIFKLFIIIITFFVIYFEVRFCKV